MKHGVYYPNRIYAYTVISL